MKNLITTLITLLFLSVAASAQLIIPPTSSGHVGDVTSVGLAAPNYFTVTNSPVTSSGTLTFGSATGLTPARVLGTCGAGTTLTLCALTAGDIPTLNQAPNTSTFQVKEEFASGTSNTGSIAEYGWVIANIAGTTSAGAVASQWNNPGIEGLTSGTTSGNGGTLYMSNSSSSGPMGALGANNNWSAEWIAAVHNATSIAARIGFANPASSPTAIPTTGLYFRYDTSLGTPDTVWMYCSDSAGVETCGSTAVTPVADTLYGFTFSSTVVGTIVFGINGVGTWSICPSGCTTTGTVSTAATQAPLVSVVTQTAASRTINLDLFLFSATGLVR